MIDLQLRYVRGAVFGQKLNVRANLVEWENRLKINYLISDLQTGERLTRASSVQVAVDMASREMQWPRRRCSPTPLKGRCHEHRFLRPPVSCGERACSRWFAHSALARTQGHGWQVFSSAGKLARHRCFDSRCCCWVVIDGFTPSICNS